MKKNIIYILLIAFSFSVKSEETPLLWKLFQQSASSAESANELYSISKNFNSETNPLLTGYKGISNMMLCNYVFSPINKLNHFKEGKKLLELAIKSDSTSAELRFFRYSVQCKTPAILGYKSNLKQDKSFLINYLINNYKSKEETVNNTILNFLLLENYCDEKEKKLLLNLTK